MPASSRVQSLPTSSPLLRTQLEGLAVSQQGKVRDIIDLGDTLLLVATDRISAFDHILGSGIPDKGKVLTQLSAYWFAATRAIVANHMVTTRVDEMPHALHAHRGTLEGRSMLVRKTVPLPIECVARGYLSGSGWKDYRDSGSVCGVPLPPGLQESAQLPEPIFTPATKATSGHDINISAQEAATIVGPERLATLRNLTLALYRFGAAHAESRGIILADTKFEFGVLPDHSVILIDEALTPDSSRYWPLDQFAPGRAQLSFDKQFVRDYLERARWNKQPPAPELPPHIIDQTRMKYLDAYRRLTGRELD